MRPRHCFSSPKLGEAANVARRRGTCSAAIQSDRSLLRDVPGAVAGEDICSLPQITHRQNSAMPGALAVQPTLAILSPETGYELNWKSSFDKISAALATVRIAARAVPWSAAMSRPYEAVCPLLAWGYNRKIAAWRRMLDGLSRECIIINSPALLRWNSTKHYLFDLERAGVPTIPTIYRSSVSRSDLRTVFREFDTETLIIKPVVGASSEGLIRIDSPDEAPAAMTDVLLQPFFNSICEKGEISLVYFAGGFSHAVCKMPRAGDIRVQEHLGGKSFAMDPPQDCVLLGERAIGACPGVPTYARVDVLRDESRLYVMELELIEPELYIPDAAENILRFAEAFAEAMQ